MRRVDSVHLQTAKCRMPISNAKGWFLSRVSLMYRYCEVIRQKTEERKEPKEIENERLVRVSTKATRPFDSLIALGLFVLTTASLAEISS